MGVKVQKQGQNLEIQSDNLNYENNRITDFRLDIDLYKNMNDDPLEPNDVEDEQIMLQIWRSMMTNIYRRSSY